jgi:hypothetical protein
MRLYCFTNYYLNSVAQGIQPLHVLGDMFVKYRGSNTDAAKMLWEWASNHKTVICLNGGNRKDISDTFDLLYQYAPKCSLPFGKFHEDEDSLGGLMTSCGVVLPASYYDAMNWRKAYDSGLPVASTPTTSYYFPNESGVMVYTEGTPSWTIINTAKSCPLAR